MRKMRIVRIIVKDKQKQHVTYNRDTNTYYFMGDAYSTEASAVEAANQWAAGEPKIGEDSTVEEEI